MSSVWWRTTVTSLFGIFAGLLAYIASPTSLNWHPQQVAERRLYISPHHPHSPDGVEGATGKTCQSLSWITPLITIIRLHRGGVLARLLQHHAAPGSQITALIRDPARISSFTWVGVKARWAPRGWGIDRTTSCLRACVSLTWGGWVLLTTSI